MIQQGKYADYPAIGIFGASPLLIANTREQPEWERCRPPSGGRGSPSENARQSGGHELAMYHGAPREQYRGIFHVTECPTTCSPTTRPSVTRSSRATPGSTA